MIVWPASADDRYGAPPPDLRLHLDRLVRSYPDWIARADDDNVIFEERNASADFRSPNG
jgi:hypothetical protein